MAANPVPWRASLHQASSGAVWHQALCSCCQVKMALRQPQQVRADQVC